ncbi:MAG: hypothetical protein H6R19_1186 [Proteobacteria bacterium]|nr:hypothetical protein [Pseudomonadota bacterium]
MKIKELLLNIPSLFAVAHSKSIQMHALAESNRLDLLSTINIQSQSSEDLINELDQCRLRVHSHATERFSKFNCLRFRIGSKPNTDQYEQFSKSIPVSPVSSPAKSVCAHLLRTFILSAVTAIAIFYLTPGITSPISKAIMWIASLTTISALSFRIERNKTIRFSDSVIVFEKKVTQFISKARELEAAIAEEVGSLESSIPLIEATDTDLRNCAREAVNCAGLLKDIINTKLLDEDGGLLHGVMDELQSKLDKLKEIPASQIEHQVNHSIA